MEGTVGVLISILMITVESFIVGFITGRASAAKLVKHFYDDTAKNNESVDIPYFMELKDEKEKAS